MNFALKEFLEGPVTLIPPVDADNKAMILTTKQRFLFFSTLKQGKRDTWQVFGGSLNISVRNA